MYAQIDWRTVSFLIKRNALKTKANFQHLYIPMKEISIFRLFLIFLKIGMTAFGGNIALVAALQKELCAKRKILNDEQVLDFTTIGNILPGPLATNVVAACGFALRGMPGLVVGLIGVILPALILICVLTELYFQYGTAPVLLKVFNGLLPGVAAIITATAWSLAKKNLKYPMQIFIVVAAGLAIILLKGFLVTLLLITISGFMGFIFLKNKLATQHIQIHATPLFLKSPLRAIICLLIIGCFIYFFHPASLLLQELRMLALTFGGMSVTLFGGGYVFIPAIEKIVVGLQHWLSAKEFADGIALGQVTPGPVAITASFVGYRVAGVLGAIVSATAIFIPPALLMVFTQQFVDRIKRRPSIEAIFMGVRPAVIGMILASVWVIGKSAPLQWQSLLIFGFVLGLLLWKKIDSGLLIVLAGTLGYFL